MNINFKRSTFQNVTFGAGICFDPINGKRYCGMAVMAGQTKKIVRVMAARKWLVEHGCPVNLARNVVSHALQG